MPKKKWDPISIFPGNSLAARFWFVTALGLFLWIVIQPVIIIGELRERDRVVLVNTETFQVAAMESFQDTEPLKNFIVSVATMALLNRGPQGPDNALLQKLVFKAKAHDKIAAYLARDGAAFKTHRMHQKVEDERVRILQTSKHTVLAAVSGQLIQIGDFDGERFATSQNFQLKMELRRNPNLGFNKSIPMTVTDWELQLTDVQQTQADSTQGGNAK